MNDSYLELILLGIVMLLALSCFGMSLLAIITGFPTTICVAGAITSIAVGWTASDMIASREEQM